ncbi:hypothetical protein BT93_L0364 [Corymbia citriodora subsp. variegata]|uniref:Uncharacterized protein n=1 Tax=Corymbia citriodora subsp. variegata TaxID=360336 RepID=A0A8T0CSF3_CORYI|nr:hypothetical protein BT93_L0364 [Corymbia citriodora subsp. variegata]
MVGGEAADQGGKDGEWWWWLWAVHDQLTTVGSDGLAKNGSRSEKLEEEGRRDGWFRVAPTSLRVADSDPPVVQRLADRSAVSWTVQGLWWPSTGQQQSRKQQQLSGRETQKKLKRDGKEERDRGKRGRKHGPAEGREEKSKEKKERWDGGR